MGNAADIRSRPLVAVLCHGSILHGRPSQYVTEHFLRPIAQAGASTLMVPALPGVVDASAIAMRCDALLLTGSATNVSPARYAAEHDEPEANPDRDHVAFDIAGRMIAARKPVLGICLGMQELCVLHGGALRTIANHGLHMMKGDWREAPIFEHRHKIDILSERMRAMAGTNSVEVTSAHRQGIERLGNGLTIEAVAEDGLIEAFCGDDEGRLVGVQWHPERAVSQLDTALFSRLVELA